MKRTLVVTLLVAGLFAVGSVAVDVAVDRVNSKKTSDGVPPPPPFPPKPGYLAADGVPPPPPFPPKPGYLTADGVPPPPPFLPNPSVATV
jgi:hypothetical protein